MHRHAREGAAELLGGAPRADDAGAQPARPPQCAALEPCAGDRSRTSGRTAARPGAGQRQRPVRSAAQRAGVAAGLAATARAGSRGAAPARAPGPSLEGVLGGAPRAATGRCARRGRAVALDVGALAGDEHPGRGRGARRPGAAATGYERRRPRPSAGPRCVRAKPPVSSAAPSVAAPAAPSTSRDVGVGRARLVEQVVAVVPPGDQAEVVHRRERRGAGADDAPRRGRAAP